MTLDEAIKHCEEKAKELRAEVDVYKNAWKDSEKEQADCLECAREHEQLAEWLKDYKRLLEEQRPRGEWTDLSTDGRHVGWIACSVCGQEPPNESNLRTDFCPNCGSDMRGDVE